MGLQFEQCDRWLAAGPAARHYGLVARDTARRHSHPDTGALNGRRYVRDRLSRGVENHDLWYAEFTGADDDLVAGIAR